VGVGGEGREVLPTWAAECKAEKIGCKICILKEENSIFYA
jgi:hypothetical protein